MKACYRHRVGRLGALVAALAVLAPQPARAYEFEVHARTITQGYELRSFRLSGGTLVLGRRRFTQALTLDIIDIGDLAATARAAQAERAQLVALGDRARVDLELVRVRRRRSDEQRERSGEGPEAAPFADHAVTVPGI